MWTCCGYLGNMFHYAKCLPFYCFLAQQYESTCVREGSLVQVGTSIDLDTVGWQFKPEQWHPCGVTWDAVPKQFMVIKLLQTSPYESTCVSPLTWTGSVSCKIAYGAAESFSSLLNLNQCCQTHCNQFFHQDKSSWDGSLLTGSAALFRDKTSQKH